MRLLFVDLVTHLFHYVRLAEVGGRVGGGGGGLSGVDDGRRRMLADTEGKRGEVVCRMALNENPSAFRNYWRSGPIYIHTKKRVYKSSTFFFNVVDLIFSLICTHVADITTRKENVDGS